MDAVQRYYQWQAHVYDWTRWAFLFGRKSAVSKAGIQPGHKVLEVGCGTGHNIQYIRQIMGDQGQIKGLDFSRDMLNKAGERATKHGWDNIEFILADATTYSSDARFDRILFIFSLTMIPDWKASLERAKEHLNPGGQVCVHDFGNFQGWGPFGPLASRWLRVNHVDTRRDYLGTMKDLFGSVEATRFMGGYTLTMVGK